MVDMFETRWQGFVDLDDPETYRGESFQIYKTVYELREWAWREIGKSLIYMDYLNGHLDWEPQRSRVLAFAKELGEEFFNRGQDTPENRLWWKKLIYKLLWEVENQC